jgi:hypothetical protein
VISTGASINNFAKVKRREEVTQIRQTETINKCILLGNVKSESRTACVHSGD